MNQLRPTLWRTCRALANETRLKLLWLVLDEEGLCVSELAKRIKTTPHNASHQLRTLSSRGLIAPEYQHLKLIYRPQVNRDVAHAEALLTALIDCRNAQMLHKVVIAQATGFTHARRIQIVRALANAPQDFESIQQTTGIDPQALNRHLNKLINRNYVAETRGQYSLRAPSNPFGRTLLNIACNEAIHPAGRESGDEC